MDASEPRSRGGARPRPWVHAGLSLLQFRPHISINGRAFADGLEALVAEWPVEIEDFLLIGHSLGGLVARSACRHADEVGHAWRKKLTNLVFLGTPHHGAPLERIGNWVDAILGRTPYAAAFGRLGKVRSAGVTDLRYGNLMDEDWQGRDRFAHEPDDQRRPVPLPEGRRVLCDRRHDRRITRQPQGSAGRRRPRSGRKRPRPPQGPRARSQISRWPAMDRLRDRPFRSAQPPRCL